VSETGERPVDWSVIARNLPEHAGNAIHTDAGAQAAGFPAALVAGVTTYAYLTRPLVAGWGREWVEHGGGEVRFRAPVFAGDRVDCVVGPGGTPDAVTVEAVCAARDRAARATFAAVRDAGPPPTARDGDRLASRRIELAGELGVDYGARAGDDLDLYAREGIVPPAVWPAIANRVFAAELVRGAWIHTRSIIRHHAAGPAGAIVDVHATVVDRFERSGRRAVADVVIEHDGVVLTTLEHEAIVELTTTRRPSSAADGGE
jgi:acyl dehydratase